MDQKEIVEIEKLFFDKRTHSQTYTHRNLSRIDNRLKYSYIKPNKLRNKETYSSFFKAGEEEWNSEEK